MPTLDIYSVKRTRSSLIHPSLALPPLIAGSGRTKRALRPRFGGVVSRKTL